MMFKTVRPFMVILLIGAYLILSICDFKEGNYKTGVVSALFAAVTWLVFC